MHVVVVGLNHKTAPVQVREKLAFSEHSLPAALAELKKYPGVGGCVIISTCNRTEIYAAVDEEPAGVEAILDFLARRSGVERAELRGYLYNYGSYTAARHLFRVAAGLDSMVLGETQILGQVKQALAVAQEHQATEKILNTLFRQALTVGKRARTETGIDQNSVSISYAAVELARQIFGTLQDRVVLIIGAGKMSELTALHLVSNGVSGVIVSNRSFERAVRLAEKFGGEAVRFSELFKYMLRADIVISCTAASHYVVRLAEMQQVMEQRGRRKLMIIDIAVPRDVDPAVGNLPGVKLYDVDALQHVIDRNLEMRRKAALRAESIIEQELAGFMQWLGSLYAVPTITALKKLGEEIKQKELRRAFNRLGELSEHDRKVIGSLANSIVNQLLHMPVVRLKEYALTPQGQLYNEVLCHLFDLPTGAEDKPNIQAAQN